MDAEATALELKSQVMWELMDSIRQNAHGKNPANACVTPNWVAWAMLDDLRLMQARITELEQQLEAAK